MSSRPAAALGDGTDQTGTIQIADGASYIVDGANIAFDDDNTQVELAGTLEVRSGLLRIEVGGDAVFDTSAGTDTLRVSGGSLTIARYSFNPTSNGVTLSHVELSGGTLGLSAPLVKLADTGIFEWTGGTLSSDGFLIPPEATLSISGFEVSLSGELINEGTTVWTAPQDETELVMIQGSTLVNRNSLTVDVTGSNRCLSMAFGGTTIENDGVLTKTGTGLFQSNAAYVQTVGATTHVAGGQIQINSQTELHGTVQLDDFTECHLNPARLRRRHRLRCPVHRHRHGLSRQRQRVRRPAHPPRVLRRHGSRDLRRLCSSGDKPGPRSAYA